MQLFRLVFSIEHTDYIVTNDVSQNWTPATQEVWGWRTKIEEFQREDKQLIGMDRCQCRRVRIVHNHINCTILVWVWLKQVAFETGLTTYQVKQSVLSDDLRQRLRSPSVQMVLA
jgi:hypothetical protein